MNIRAVGPATDLNEQQSSHAKLLLKQSLSHNTRRGYDSDWRDWTEWCSDNGIDPFKAKSAAVENYLAQCEHVGLKPATIKRRSVTINRAYDLLVRSGRVKTNPCDDALRARIVHAANVRNKGVTGEKDPFTVESITAMARTCDGTLSGVRDVAMLTMQFATGSRASEVAVLTMRDIVWDRGGDITIIIRRSKTDQEWRGFSKPVPRTNSPICPVRWLERWLALAQVSEGPVFRRVFKNTRVGPNCISVRSMLIAYNDLANAAGVDGNFGTHSCRIGFVTEALANGVDPITVKNMTGHEALASVARYARPKVDAQKATVRAVLGVEQRRQIK